MENIGTMVQVQTKLNAPDFDELSDLFHNPNRWFSPEILKEATEDHLLKKDKYCNFAVHNNSIHSKIIDYIFRCEICAEIGMQDQWYRVILDEIGGTPFLHRRTRGEDVFSGGYTGSNLLKILPGDKTDYQHSSINRVPGFAYVCDHCRDSCFDEKGNMLK